MAPWSTRLAGLLLLVLLLTDRPGLAEGKNKKAKKKGSTSVQFGDGGGAGTGYEGESDEEFRARLLGSDTPQAQRIVTGVDPRLAAAEAEAAEGEDGQAPPAGGGSDTWGTRLDKLADDELSPEDREAKRNTELWKAGNKAKEFGYKWKAADEEARARMREELNKAGYDVVDA